MATRRWMVSLIAAAATCTDTGAGPEARLIPNFELGGAGRPAVLVNANASEEGTPRTIQEGIDMVAPGGTVMVLPGTYDASLVIDKGLTLEALGGESGLVIVAAPPGASDAIQVTATDPVVIRGLSVQYGTLNGSKVSARSI
jgi:nitrous oxidase accessory protein NosD